MKDFLSIESKQPLGRTYWSIWAGQSISQFGSLATGISIVVWLQDLGAKPDIIGAYFSFASFIIIFAGLIAGPLSDRAPRRVVIVGTDALAMFAVIGLAIVAAHKVDLTTALITAFLVRGFIVGSFSLRFPSIMTEIAATVPSKGLKKAQSIYGTSRQLAGMVGEASGGTMYAIAGRQVIFIFDALTYFVSILCTLNARKPAIKPEEAISPKENLSKIKPQQTSILGNFLSDLTAGFIYVKQEHGLVGLVVCMVSLNVFFAPLAVWLPFLIRERLAGSTAELGWAQAALGLGMLVGSLGAGFIRFSAKLSTQITASLVLLGLAFFSMSFSPTPFFATVCLAILGSSVGFFNVSVTSHIQSRTPSELRGRVFALTMILGQVANPLAQGCVGLFARELNGRYELLPLVTGVGTLIVVIGVLAAAPLKSYLDNAQNLTSG